MYKMKNMIVVMSLLGVLVLVGVKYLMPYLEKDECRALLAQYQEYKHKGWYATRDWVDTCNIMESNSRH